MLKLENEFLKTCYNPVGSEIISIISKESGLEYLWQGKSSLWERQNPLLFPVIASLENNTYEENGKTYILPMHGFALNSTFKVVYHDKQTIRFQLTDSPKTHLIFPFCFNLLVEYFLHENFIDIKYSVLNTDERKIKFCIGGHPTFACPLVKDTRFTDYYLQFEKNETINRLLMDGPYLNNLQEPLLVNDRNILLKKSLFLENAIITEGWQSKYIGYFSMLHKHGVRIHFEGHPFLGIFSNALSETDEYICIEPWFGLPARRGRERTLDDKPGIIIIESQESFQSKYSIEII